MRKDLHKGTCVFEIHDLEPNTNVTLTQDAVPHDRANVTIQLNYMPFVKNEDPAGKVGEAKGGEVARWDLSWFGVVPRRVARSRRRMDVLTQQAWTATSRCVVVVVCDCGPHVGYVGDPCCFRSFSFPYVAAVVLCWPVMSSDTHAREVYVRCLSLPGLPW